MSNSNWYKQLGPQSVRACTEWIGRVGHKTTLHEFLALKARTFSVSILSKVFRGREELELGLGEG